MLGLASAKQNKTGSVQIKLENNADGIAEGDN